MRRQHPNADRTLLLRAEADEPNDSAVSVTPDDCELAKVLVESHEDAALRERTREDLDVARIFRPLSSGSNVVARLFE